MFNLQGSEIIFILLIALVVLGPEKLPGAIRKATQTYAEFRKMSSSFQSEFKSVIDEPLREMRETADLVKETADPKKMAERAEAEAEADAQAEAEADAKLKKKADQAASVTAAMQAGRTVDTPPELTVVDDLDDDGDDDGDDEIDEFADPVALEDTEDSDVADDTDALDDMAANEDIDDDALVDIDVADEDADDLVGDDGVPGAATA